MNKKKFDHNHSLKKKEEKSPESLQSVRIITILAHDVGFPNRILLPLYPEIIKKRIKIIFILFIITLFLKILLN